MARQEHTKIIYMNIFSRKPEQEQPRQTGKFIVIDGADGTGKATQTELLAQTLGMAGYDGAVLDFPQYNTASAAMLEKYLRGEYGNLNPEAASILYAIDRFDAKEKLQDYLSQGKIILANRYVTSNAGHQGAKIQDYEDRVKFYKWLRNLEFTIFDIPQPDLNIVLHVPTEISWGLIEERSAREGRFRDLHEMDRSHLEAAERTYVEIASLFPNTRLVECVEGDRLLTPQEVHGKVWDLVRRIALKDIPPHHEIA